MQFATRILSFVESLNITTNERQDLLKALVRYTLHVNGTQRATILRKKAFALDKVPEVMHFKIQYLDVSSYIQLKLWKGVVGFLKGHVVDDEIKDDVKYCLSFLNSEDCTILKNIGLNEESNVEDFDVDQWTKDKNVLQWVRKKIYKLKFISDYDPSIDLEDFSQDLACEVFRIINTYQRVKRSPKHSQEPLQLRLEKYVDGALANKINNIIEHHTSISRRRAVSTNDELYKKLKAAKKSLNKAKRTEEISFAEEAKVKEILASIQNTESDYYSQTTDIDEGEDIGINRLDINYGINYSETEDQWNELLWAESFKAKLGDPRDLDYVKLVLEDPELDHSFHDWVEAQGRKVKSAKGRLRLAQKFIKAKDRQGDYANYPTTVRWDKDNLFDNGPMLRMFA